MQILEPGLAPALVRGAKTVALFFQASLWTLLGVVVPAQREAAQMCRWKFIGKFTAHTRHQTIREEGH